MSLARQQAGLGSSRRPHRHDLSATNGKARPAFQRLLESDPGAILVWHTDRLVRLTRDMERVIALNVNVYALHAGLLNLRRRRAGPWLAR